MSDTQEFEKAAASSPTTVAAFVTQDKGAVKRIQQARPDACLARCVKLPRRRVSSHDALSASW